MKDLVEVPLSLVRCKSIYVNEAVYENGRIPPEQLQPIGRLAGSMYTRVNDFFSMDRVPPPEA